MVFLCCRRGAIVTTFITCYALTSFIAGYVSGGMYSRHGGTYLHPSVSWFFCFLSSSFAYGSIVVNRQKLDQVDDSHRLSLSIYVLWGWVHPEHNCHFLWIFSSHSLWHHCGSFCNMGFYFLPSGSSWHCCWKKLEWCSKQSMSCENHSPSNSWEEMVPHTICGFDDGRTFALWQHIHWDVLCLHILLELQGEIFCFIVDWHK